MGFIIDAPNITMNTIAPRIAPMKNTGILMFFFSVIVLLRFVRYGIEKADKINIRLGDYFMLCVKSL